MVEIVATREIQYAGKRVLAGERFDATEKDAKIYIAVKRATPVPDRVEAPAMLMTMTAPEFHAAPEAAAPPEAPEAPKEEAAPEAPAHPRQYHRRDMVAEPPSGPTGPAKPSPSSRQARPRKAKR
jgi:hypothetical protein